MTYLEVARRLKKLGCDEIPRRGRGSHRKWHNPKTGQSTVLPDWGNKDLKMGTIRAALKQLGVEWQDFDQR